MSETCQHRWRFVDGQTTLTCVKCGTTTEPWTPDQLVEDMLKDIVTMGSAWSKGGERIDPASVFKDHGALHSCSYHCDRPECIKAQRDELRDRLAQPEQEPVAYIEHHKGGDNLVWDDPGGKRSPLYTAPPQRKPLTDEEISDLWCKVSNTDFVTADTHEFARAIEAKLKEKNNG